MRALTNGTTPADCFALLKDFRARHPDIPVGILTYANLVVARGREDFYARAAAAGVDSVLVADVPVLEAAPYAGAARAHGIDPVLIAAANTPAHRLREIAELGGGYTYCVARAGVTGADESVRFDHAAMLEALREAGRAAPVFGFGISRPQHVRAALAAGAAGVISGSAIVERVARGRGCRRLRQGDEGRHALMRRNNPLHRAHVHLHDRHRHQPGHADARAR